MPTRDQDRCRTGTCREEVLDHLFSGRFPSERHAEFLLDRLEREDAGRDGPGAREPR